ncbi:HD domain-containing phosphohydrolase [Treponema sp.]|uniref:HD domain-containing phosphohydrolase n=1 Tax=Treponema sp. TaxID=166 RepID=UPI003EFCE178
MELTKGTRRKIIFLYLGITAVSNLIAAMIPITFSTPTVQASFMSGWIEFLEKYTTLTNLVSVMNFLIPLVLCIVYASRSDAENFYSRFINLPIAYSFIGITGWIAYFLIEIIILFSIRNSYDIQIASIIFTSSIYITLEALLSFTLSYFIMETLHRKKFLPKYFPGGNLCKIKGTITPSMKFLFIALYISTVLFPVFYLLSIIATAVCDGRLSVDRNSIFMLFSILFFGILLFVIFKDYFSSPLKELQKKAGQITEGNYSAKANIVTTDSFGVLADTFNEMIAALDEKTKHIFRIQNSIITGMAAMVESRDNSTGGHIKRTSECVRIFMGELKNTEAYKDLPDSFCQAVIKAAPMHDLGKIAVDDAILRKPGKFTDEEYEKMKRHSAEGARIIENVLAEVDDPEFKRIAINIAHYHHEKYNGQGYPDKLAAEQIPLEARIMALADVFDALVSKRCYKDTFSYDKAFGIIEDSLATHFDPELGRVFISCREKLESLYNTQYR